MVTGGEIRRARGKACSVVMVVMIVVNGDGGDGDDCGEWRW